MKDPARKPAASVKAAAVRLANEVGLINLTRDMLALDCGFPADSFQHYTGVTFSALVEALEREGHTGPVTTVQRARTNPRLRKQQVLGAACAIAREIGYQNLGRPDVAEAAGVSQATVSHYFGTLDNLKALVMDYAVRHEMVEIVAQGLGSANEIAKDAPDDLKNRALDYLKG